MDVLVVYLGHRKDTLKTYNLGVFRKGPYNFSSGSCIMDEADAKVMLQRNIRGFRMGSAEELAKVKATRNKKPPVKPKPPVK